MQRRRLISRVVTALVLFVLELAGPDLLFGQGLEYIKANYTKFEYRVPMRDGVHLFTSVYVPKDQSRAYPIMLSRTPYSVAALWYRRLQVRPRAFALVRQGRLHRSLSGCAWPIHVGR